MFTASVDATQAIAMLDRLAQSADFVCREVALDTAKRIVAEARSREKRAVSAAATGVTESGIHWEMTRDGKGYVVLGYTAGLQPDPIDLYLEHGTSRMYAKPFFFSAAMLEEGPYLRRLIERMAQWLDEVGR